MQWRRARSIVLVSCLVTLAGCLMDATIDATGAGTMTLKYRLTSEAQLYNAKMRMRSPHVTLTSARVDGDKWATFELSFADVTKLSTIELFSTAAFSLIDGEDGTKTFGARFVNDNPNPLPDEMVAYFGDTASISLNLPGDIVKSNAMTAEGAKATWTYPLNEFTNMREIELSATFRIPKEKDEAGGAAGDARADIEDSSGGRQPAVEGGR